MDGGGLQGVFLGEVEKAAGQLDLVDLPHHQILGADDGAAHLKAGDGLLQDHLVVVLPGQLQGGQELLLPVDLGDAVGRARFHRLDKEGIARLPGKGHGGLGVRPRFQDQGGGDVYPG